MSSLSAYGPRVAAALRSMTLSPSERGVLRQPWYHNFALLGFRTKHFDPHHRLNQECKEPPIRRLLQEAVRLSRRQQPGVKLSAVELFCADGFYSNIGIRLGIHTVTGIDRNAKEISKARLMAKVLGNSGRVRFAVGDVWDLEGRYDQRFSF